ncbi:MAG TPA: OmpH family outer membrane protein [Candidatus Brocadiia bacterium]|nr:OmpH family outer membrane protein [Planctomycetota bacterium]MDO8092132.1 OmpH family outer membrane protein [Candidatus Brocadiales bacterium]
MKKKGCVKFIKYFFLVLSAGILSSSVSFAKDVPEETSQQKIGVVNINRVLDKYEKRKELEKQFMAAKTQTEQQLRQKQGEIKSLREEVQLLDMGSESRRKNEETLEKKMLYYQLEEKMAETNLSRKEKEIFEELYQDVCKEIDNLGKKESFDIILKKEDLELKSADILELRLKIGIGTVLYYSDALDVTDKVIEALNSRHSKQIEEK